MLPAHGDAPGLNGSAPDAAMGSTAAEAGSPGAGMQLGVAAGVGGEHAGSADRGAPGDGLHTVAGGCSAGQEGGQHEESDSDEDVAFDYDRLVEAQQEGADTDPTDDKPTTGNGRKRHTRGGNQSRAKRRKTERFLERINTIRASGMALPNSIEKMPWMIKKAVAFASSAGAAASSSATAPPSGSSAAGAAPGGASEGPTTPAAATAAVAEQAAAPSPAAGAIERPAPLDYSDAVAEGAQSEERSTFVDTFDKTEKEGKRRLHASQEMDARTIFVTNLPFKVCTKHGLGEFLDKHGKIEDVLLHKDKATSNACGYAHVRYETVEAAKAAVAHCDWFEVQERVIRVCPAERGAKLEFELPPALRKELAALVEASYEGSNISAVKQAWQKQHSGQKLKAEKWGFKNFSTAMATVEGIALEKHIEKGLTVLAFVKGSAKHEEFLANKKKHEAEKAAKEEEAKAAKQEEAPDASTEGAADPASKAPGPDCSEGGR